MAETFGSLELRLSQLPHGASVAEDVLGGFINDRTQALIAHWPWSRLNIDTILPIPSSYLTGTVSVANGGTSLVLTGGTWTSAMNGFRMRIDARPEFYAFTFVDATDGTLDRPFEGPTDATGSYKLWKAIYTLPENVDFLQSIECPRLQIDLDQTSQEILDFNDPGRQYLPDALAAGSGMLSPLQWAPYQDDPVSGNSQIELYPGPEVQEGLPMRYRSKIPRFVYPDDQAKTFLDWIDTGVIADGVQADLYRLEKDYNGYQSKQADWMAGLARMVSQDNQRIVPQQLRMADKWVRHRIDRATGGDELRQERYLQM